ncbi:hypothetical protein LCL85_05675 [Vibrio alginolyticus]|nr:hypothetical protein [Vibrio alginolyticus]
MKILLLIYTLTSISLFPLLVKADSMNIFQKRLVHLCPEINGRLMDGDKPLRAKTIKRGIAYGELYEDETVTDEKGNFSFPVHEYETRKPLNPLDEKRVLTYLFVEIDGEKRDIWYSTINSLSPINKLVATLSDLKCDINEPDKVFSISHGKDNKITNEIYTLCSPELLTYKGLYE